MFHDQESEPGRVGPNVRSAVTGRPWLMDDGQTVGRTERCRPRHVCGRILLVGLAALDPLYT